MTVAPSTFSPCGISKSGSETSVSTFGPSFQALTLKLLNVNRRSGTPKALNVIGSQRSVYVVLCSLDNTILDHLCLCVLPTRIGNMEKSIIHVWLPFIYYSLSNTLEGSKRSSQLPNDNKIQDNPSISAWCHLHRKLFLEGSFHDAPPILQREIWHRTSQNLHRTI